MQFKPFKTDDGYRVDLSLGRDANRKRLRKTIKSKTLAGVKKKANDYLARQKAGEVSDVPSQLLGAYLTDWWGERNQYTIDEREHKNEADWDGLRPNTLRSYEGIIRLHIQPFEIAKLPINELTVKMINQFYRDLRKTEPPRSERVITLVHAVMHKSLKDAVRSELISTNPSNDAMVNNEAAERKGKRKSVRGELWNKLQMLRFVKAAEGDRLHALFVLAPYSGCRQGELLGLQWNRLHITSDSEGVLNVTHQLTEAKDPKTQKIQCRLEQCKTDGSNRPVPIGRRAVKALLEHRKRMEMEAILRGQPLKPDDLVFCTSNGGPIRKSNLRQRHYMPVVAAAGLPYIPFHKLRALCATMFHKAGADLKDIKSHLGHSNLEMTDWYVYADLEKGKLAAKQFEDWLEAG